MEEFEIKTRSSWETAELEAQEQIRTFKKQIDGLSTTLDRLKLNQDIFTKDDIKFVDNLYKKKLIEFQQFVKRYEEIGGDLRKKTLETEKKAAMRRTILEKIDEDTEALTNNTELLDYFAETQSNLENHLEEIKLKLSDMLKITN